ncbi:P-loop containing nucleoside triphosphate hydrolase protein [Nemania sp. NC0429]|nr:P-loop containing nucleoside triphosphate hydrolase protein [Nemania sp. NC0429]
MPPSSDDKTPGLFLAPVKLIAVMGLTGTGKTTFINTLARAQLKTSDGLRSCTKDVGSASMTWAGHEVRLIDSPGFDDTELNDSDILTQIAAYLKLLTKEKLHLTGLLYFYNISHVRAGRSAVRNIRTFRKLVGDGNMANVVLVTTRWDLARDEKEDVLNRRVAELESEEGFWGGMMKYGARHEKLKDVEQDGKRILESLVGKETVEVQLQSELREGRKLVETAAGQEVNEELDKLKQEHEKEMASILKELEEARKEGHAADIAVLVQEREKAGKQQEKVDEALLKLKDGEILDLKEQLVRQARQNLDIESRRPCIIL